MNLIYRGRNYKVYSWQLNGTPGYTILWNRRLFQNWSEVQPIIGINWTCCQKFSTLWTNVKGNVLYEKIGLNYKNIMDKMFYHSLIASFLNYQFTDHGQTKMENVLLTFLEMAVKMFVLVVKLIQMSVTRCMRHKYVIAIATQGNQCRYLIWVISITR